MLRAAEKVLLVQIQTLCGQGVAFQLESATGRRGSYHGELLLDKGLCLSLAIDHSLQTGQRSDVDGMWKGFSSSDQMHMPSSAR